MTDFRRKCWRRSPPACPLVTLTQQSHQQLPSSASQPMLASNQSGQIPQPLRLCRTRISQYFKAFTLITWLKQVADVLTNTHSIHKKTRWFLCRLILTFTRRPLVSVTLSPSNETWCDDRHGDKCLGVCLVLTDEWKSENSFRDQKLLYKQTELLIILSLSMFLHLALKPLPQFV